MKKILLLPLAILPLWITSCATPPPPPQPFHHADTNALIIDSLDEKTCRLLHPDVGQTLPNDKALDHARTLTPRQTAVVILESYTEQVAGNGFRDRSTPLFVGLRTLGYEHIFFLQGRGVTNPEGLMVIARYD